VILKAASLLLVFAVAKVLVVAGRSGDPGPWALAAWLWQDVLAALLLGAAAALVRPRRLEWMVYAAAVAYAAVNVPVARVLSTPLTWPMLRGARGAISDSIEHHATAGNLACAFLVLLAGAVVPLVLRRAPRSALVAGLLLAAPLIVLGPRAARTCGSYGLARNAILAIPATAFPRLSASGGGAREPAVLPGADEDRGATSLPGLRGAAAGRNVVLVLLESAGARYLKPYGAAEDPMPNLTRLASRSIVVEEAYAAYPESIKGLFSVLCSTHPAADTPAEAYAGHGPPSLAAMLAGAGYRTGLFHSGRFMYLGMEDVVEGRGFEVLEDAGDIGGRRDSSFGIDEESAVRRILSWVDGLDGDERFFVTYLPIAGHHPYEVPPGGPFSGADEPGRYLNALHYADRALGELLGGLRERGLEESTLFVLAGDHGEAFHQHEGNYGHTMFIYEENVRVPFVIAAPGLVGQEVRIPGVASLVDAAPTVLDLLGLQAPAGYEGASLLRSGRGPAYFFTDYATVLLGIRDGRWKLIHEVESARSLLFDLESDPEERRDVSGLHPHRVALWRDLLLDRARAARARWTVAAAPRRGVSER
jgi:arylsulfatase A-like enzyme